jgi:hypothetical protein
LILDAKHTGGRSENASPPNHALGAAGRLADAARRPRLDRAAIVGALRSNSGAAAGQGWSQGPGGWRAIAAGVGIDAGALDVDAGALFKRGR